MSAVRPRVSTANREFDLIIVGAGITGSVMASLALARGLCAPGRVALVGNTSAAPAASAAASNADRDWDLRVFALSRASQRLLTLCGVWPLLPAGKLCAYERMCIWDNAGGAPAAAAASVPAHAGSIHFDCAELGEPNLGFIVEARALHEQARRAAAAAGTVIIDAAVAAVANGSGADEVRVRLGDARELQASLLIVADGADSPTRRLLGIETAGHAYHQDALVAHVRTAMPHRQTAWQRFLPTGPLAFLPLPDGRSSIVWSVARAEALRLRGLDAAAFGAALGAASGGMLGACELTTAVASFPLKLQYAVDYLRPRAVLVGDAAHAVHPLAGQGLNLGLLDCAALAQVLDGAAGGVADGGRLGERRSLRRYERWRKSENLLVATATDGLERLFSSGNPVLSRLRAAGLSFTERMPFIKRDLAERALGLRGDLPAFLR